MVAPRVCFCDAAGYGKTQSFRFTFFVFKLACTQSFCGLKSVFSFSHAINLLSNLPVQCLDALIDVPVQGGLEKYGGKNLDVVQVLLDFMEKRIDKVVHPRETHLDVVNYFFVE